MRGDFDLCPDCVLRHGIHCLDSRHWLREFAGGWKMEEKYYSSVRKVTGEREICIRE